MSFKFFTELKVHFDECDMAGIVHNSNYLKYFERGRTAYLSNLGLDYNLETLGEDYFIVVRENFCRYLKPAKFNDSIKVYVRTVSIGKSSWKVEYNIFLRDELITDGYTLLVKTDESYSKPKRITDKLKNLVLSYEGIQ
ncbi:MAG: acyl-CoA thioesterase [Candidatus Delongbacteria bacterium]|nr:acyl-CoA thioesterase [Candidatus Delongbacteria bacterium]MBN2834970.1 acyl-CoA thioesterase [Candidatus Delongbacteria bacterium]